MKKIFAVWNPAGDTRQAERCAIWARSWKARGWEPRILTPREKTRNVKRQTVSFGCINFSLTPRQKFSVTKFDAPGWESAGAVDFGTNASPEFILSCGPTF